jgi:hypothetical protein
MSKIMREARRAAGKLRDLIAVLPERVAQKRRDQNLGDDLRQTAGAVPLGQRAALFVLWQPSGLAPSTLLTCDHLRAQGFAPVAVSNAPLTDRDRAALAARTALVIERPNLGHDFGAWRDVILLWLRSARLPENGLLLLNDSIWFPLSPDDDLLTRIEAEALTHGFTGAVWMERPGRPHSAHYQSYLLMFGPRALTHPAFAAFWQGYLASSRRDSVLARGEKGLSRAMSAAGLAAPATVSPARLLADAKAAPAPELARILDYAALVQPDRRTARDALLAHQTEEGFRPKALDLIAASLFSGHFAETHPYLISRSTGLHLLKKRAEPTSTEGRRQYLRAVAAGDIIAPAPEILAEIRARTPAIP